MTIQLAVLIAMIPISIVYSPFSKFRDLVDAKKDKKPMDVAELMIFTLLFVAILYSFGSYFVQSRESHFNKNSSAVRKRLYQFLQLYKILTFITAMVLEIQFLT